MWRTEIFCYFFSSRIMSYLYLKIYLLRSCKMIPQYHWLKNFLTHAARIISSSSLQIQSFVKILCSHSLQVSTMEVLPVTVIPRDLWTVTVNSLEDSALVGRMWLVEPVAGVRQGIMASLTAEVSLDAFVSWIANERKRKDYMKYIAKPIFLGNRKPNNGIFMA